MTTKKTPAKKATKIKKPTPPKQRTSISREREETEEQDLKNVNLNLMGFKAFSVLDGRVRIKLNSTNVILEVGLRPIELSYEEFSHFLYLGQEAKNYLEKEHAVTL